MAAVTAGSSILFVARAALVPNPKLGSSSSSFVLGFPKMARVAKIRCSMEDKPSTLEKEASPSMAMVASLAAAVAAAMSSPAAVALVDKRMSTEGTGLPFGLSNNLLGWILLGVFGLIWSFYTVYTSGLDEDEDSGLSL